MRAKTDGLQNLAKTPHGRFLLVAQVVREFGEREEPVLRGDVANVLPIGVYTNLNGWRIEVRQSDHGLKVIKTQRV